MVTPPRDSAEAVSGMSTRNTAIKSFIEHRLSDYEPNPRWSKASRWVVGCISVIKRCEPLRRPTNDTAGLLLR